MATWYISTTGSDTTGNGTLGNPYATISKTLTVCANTDVIKLLDGTYTITSTTNINKQVTITSNSTNKTLVILNANCTIYNIQESNVSITYMTLQSSSTDAIITIDRMSDGSIVPTFWTGNVINNCNIKYVTVGVTLNGTFTVSSNTFTRNSGSNIADIITIYSSRGSCNVSSNTFTDSGPVRYVTYLTSSGSGTYLDRCNSKGGTMTIANNTVTYTGSQSTLFIMMDYFNQYSYGTVGQDNQYNINTKLGLSINNNNISTTTLSKFIYININSNNDIGSLSTCNINTNTVNNTDYGTIHLEKNTNNHSIVTIPSSDLNRSVFKIYNNSLDTIEGLITQFDSSDLSTLFQDTAGTIPVTTVGQVVRCWKSTSQSKISVNATASSANAKLATFTTGTSAIDFNPLYNDGTVYTYTHNLSAYSNASYIAVFYLTLDSVIGHVLSNGDALLAESGNVHESFYTNVAGANGGRTAYSYVMPIGVPYIYAVTANSTTSKTKCYRYTTSLTQISPDLPYGTLYKTTTTKYLGLVHNTSISYFKLAEIKIYGSCIPDSMIVSECEALKTKWNIS